MEGKLVAVLTGVVLTGAGVVLTGAEARAEARAEALPGVINPAAQTKAFDGSAPLQNFDGDKKTPGTTSTLDLLIQRAKDKQVKESLKNSRISTLLSTLTNIRRSLDNNTGDSAALTAQYDASALELGKLLANMKNEDIPAYLRTDAILEALENIRYSLIEIARTGNNGTELYEDHVWAVQINSQRLAMLLLSANSPRPVQSILFLTPGQDSITDIKGNLLDVSTGKQRKTSLNS